MTSAHHYRHIAAMEKPGPIQDLEYERALSLLSQSSTFFSDTEADCLADTLTINHDASSQASKVEAQYAETKPGPRLYTLLRFILLNTYRRLFSIVFVGNAIALILVLIHGISLLNLVNAAAANLLLCSLARQPLVVNILFKYGCKIPISAPLRLRMIAAKVFHYGGVHSGTGVASCMWYIAFVGNLTYTYQRPSGHNSTATAVLVLAWLVLIILCAIIVAAYPAIRMKMHDSFELTHRFSGWTVVILFWALFLTFASNQPPSMGGFLIRQPTFWILFILTAAIIQPWAMLRHVHIQPEILSTHAIRLHFDHTTVDFGQGLSVSHHPLKDWHSFASFPDHYDSPDTKFSMVISKAGDWTSGVIAKPPTRLWKRGVPMYGFAYVMRMFSSMILVTTGSGIGPCLSFLGLHESERPRFRILWQTRTPERTYGKGVIDLVKRLDPDPVVIDTSKQGKRIDMLPFVMKLYREFGAETVCVISNPKLTGDLVYGLESRGIPAYGPIFDS